MVVEFDVKVFISTPKGTSISNEGVTSWCAFALAIFEFTGIDCSVNSVTSELFPTQARRAAYSVLNTQKIKEAYGLKIPHWRNSLEKMIKEYYK